MKILIFFKKKIFLFFLTCYPPPTYNFMKFIFIAFLCLYQFFKKGGEFSHSFSFVFVHIHATCFSRLRRLKVNLFKCFTEYFTPPPKFPKPQTTLPNVNMISFTYFKFILLKRERAHTHIQQQQQWKGRQSWTSCCEDEVV